MAAVSLPSGPVRSEFGKERGARGEQWGEGSMTRRRGEEQEGEEEEEERGTARAPGSTRRMKRRGSI